ncbi:predicted protein [Sclerotinia sclerotiorum 1980 UF-70]|uniref:Uncharacterized protein n=1 Tax=Sclerotinia sclerotiorum (strain ATCC 18683 / 1980 / Ss-1) TaxID=665079 RepID=A7ESJ9_SCLS1|nr:predicted protein [Sclerotinia sclerotiorum 1980 UF-70]EDN92441.1 predicted protein [Sclerotinia sclerotiorum 1980 UF-70]
MSLPSSNQARLGVRWERTSPAPCQATRPLHEAKYEKLEVPHCASVLVFKAWHNYTYTFLTSYKFRCFLCHAVEFTQEVSARLIQKLL